MKKKCKVVALPTNEKTKNAYNGEIHNFFEPTTDNLKKKDDFVHLYIVNDDDIEEGDIMMLKIKEHPCGLLRKCHWAREGRFYMDPKGWGFCYQHEAYKVIATTDPSLNLPLIPEQIVNDYCIASGIEEVEICLGYQIDTEINLNKAYEKFFDTYGYDPRESNDRLAYNSYAIKNNIAVIEYVEITRHDKPYYVEIEVKLENNIISISPIKQSYTKEEVELLYRKAFSSGWDAGVMFDDNHCVYQGLEDEFIKNNL